MSTTRTSERPSRCCNDCPQFYTIFGLYRWLVLDGRAESAVPTLFLKADEIWILGKGSSDLSVTWFPSPHCSETVARPSYVMSVENEWRRSVWTLTWSHQKEHWQLVLQKTEATRVSVYNRTSKLHHDTSYSEE